jgi:hypothetical protein
MSVVIFIVASLSPPTSAVTAGEAIKRKRGDRE